jgi:hypothetical protein
MMAGPKERLSLFHQDGVTMLNPFRRRPHQGRSPGHKQDRRALDLEALEARAVPAVIGGTVYQDLNTNGLFDTGEPGLPGSTLALLNSNGRVVATTTSGPNGQYQFTTLNTGPQPGTLEYDAVFNPTPTNTSQNQSVSQFNPALGMLTEVDVIVTGSLQSSVQMENLSPGSNQVQAQLGGSLSYQVGDLQPLSANPGTTLSATLPGFTGTQANLTGPSAKNFGTVNMAGTYREVTLTNPQDLSAFEGTGTVAVSETANANATTTESTGNLLALISTTAQGKVKVIYHYTPSNALPPGQYTIVQTKAPPGGYIPGLDTSDNITPIPGSRTNRTISVTVNTPTDTLLNNNFGELLPAAISGHVYVDVNKVGSIQPGDPGIRGVRIILTGTDAFGEAIQQVARTNGNGVYGFGNLLPGTYQVTETPPAGYQKGSTTAGSLGGQAQGYNITNIPVSQSDAGTDYNFGEILTHVPPPPPPQITPTPPGTPIFPPSKFFLFGW